MLGFITFLLISAVLLIALLTAMLAWEMRHPPRHTAGYALARGMACDPCDMGLDFESWNLDRPDGAVLPVWEINPKSASQNPKSMTAVFIHGWGHSRIDALARIQPFLQWCDRIVLYDLRGHGDSQHCTSSLGQDESDDLLALLAQLGEGRFVLIGHSMGAVIAIAAAADNDPIAERIAAIIAYAPYCSFRVSLRGRLRAAGLPRQPIADLALLVQKISGVTPRNLTEQDFKNLSCPVLIIHGDQDAVAPIEHGRRIALAVGNGSCMEVAGAAHVDGHLVNEAEHIEQVRAFIERLRGDVSCEAV